MPLKRNEILAKLSRDHHLALLMAQVLKTNGPAYAGTTRDAESRKKYVEEFFQDNLKKHFETEEQIVFPMSEGLTDEIKILQTQLKEEHEQMRSAIVNLATANNLEEELNLLGILLDRHVRTEERQLFEMIQKSADQNWFDELKNKLKEKY